MDQDNVLEFLPYLENTKLTHEEKLEVLQILWRLVDAQVDIAFGVHPVQLAIGNQREIGLPEPKKSLDSKICHISPRYRQAANDDCQTTQSGGQKNAPGQ